MMKLRLLSAAALTALMVFAAPAMTSQAAMFTTCLPGSSSGSVFKTAMISGNFGQVGGQGFCGDFSCGDCLNGTDCLNGGCQTGNRQTGNCQTGNCQTGNCQAGGNCQGGNTGAGWQNGIQTIPSFGGRPAASMQKSCR